MCLLQVADEAAMQSLDGHAADAAICVVPPGPSSMTNQHMTSCQ